MNSDDLGKEESGDEDSLPDTERIESQPPLTMEPGSTATDTGQRASCRRGATGPRTPTGKARSKRNALKHGIFSSVATIKGESRVEFLALLRGLEVERNPEGLLEHILVEQAAVYLWRKRRCIAAESAEIMKAQADAKIESAPPTTREVVVRVIAVFDNEGLMRPQEDDDSTKCLRLLRELADTIKASGFDEDRDLGLLKKLYGNSPGGSSRQRTLRDSYETWLAKADSFDSDDKNGEYSPEQCIANFIEETGREIGRLEQERSRDLERIKLERIRQSVPDGPQLDRLLRYESHLDKMLDRTLALLERAQRMRLGQQVPPRIEVDVTR